MARNALIPQLQPFELPAGPNIAALTNPLMAGFERADKLRQQSFQNDRALTAESQNERRLGMAEKQFSSDQERREVERLGKLAQVINDDPNDATASQRWQSVLQGNPQMGSLLQKYGVDPNDHRTGAKFLAAEVGAYLSPAQKEMEAAKLAQIKAQTANIGADSYAAGDGFIYNKRTGAVQPMPEGVGGSNRYGKQGTIFQGPDGQFYTMQFAGDGTRKVLPVEVDGKPLSPSRGVQAVDTGTGTRLVDKATGTDVREISKNIAGAEQAKVEGRERGETIANRTKAETAITQLEAKQKNVVQIIDRALPEVNRLTAGFGGTLLSKVPGTAAADLARLVDTVKANVGFDALQGMRDASPTGGALGGIAVQELQMLQAVIASLEQSQSPAQLRDNLVRVRQTIDQFRTIRRQAFDKTYPQQPQVGAPAQPQAAPQAQPSSALPPGNYVYDPASGQLRPAR